jgi:hypothetical protein
VLKDSLEEVVGAARSAVESIHAEGTGMKYEKGKVGVGDEGANCVLEDRQAKVGLKQGIIHLRAVCRREAHA